MAGPLSSDGSRVGTQFAGFDILEQAGSGGMGVVYRAMDRKLGRDVALKFLPCAYPMGSPVRERFLREARAASILDHPNIGAIFSIEEAPDGELCIVMPYYDGETLAERLTAAPLRPSDAIRIALDLAEGLGAAHARRVIHRDIKPSNIMLTRAGQTKIVDFGLAKIFGRDEPLTDANVVMGTPHYMSPEQVQGAEVGPASDVWSLGVVLYEMLSQRTPFRRNDPRAIMYAIVHEAPDPLPHAPAGLERIVSKALAKDPLERYSTMQEFARDLRSASAELEKQEAAETQPLAPAPAPAGFPSRRRRAIALTAAAAAMALAIAAAVPGLRGRVASLVSGPWSADHVTLAVLPFSSADESTSALAGGLAQAIAARMQSVEQFKDTLILTPAELAPQSADPDVQAKRLGAKLLVAGRIRRDASGALHLRVEVRDPTGRNSSVGSVHQPDGDPRRLEDRAMAEVARMLDLTTEPHLLAASRRRGAGAAQAYEAYLRGVGHLQRWDRAENIKSAIEAFGEAVRTDPGFALAYVGLAEASRTRFNVEKDADHIQHALNYSQRAVQIDPALPEAHVVLGNIYRDTAQRDLAVLEFQRALSIEPRNAAAIGGMARAYEDLGRMAEAESSYRRAAELHPYRWAAYNALANFYVRRGRYGDAEKEFRRALDITPDNPAVYSNLGVVLIRLRNYAGAMQMFQRSLALAPGYAAYSNLGNIYYHERQFGKAADTYRKALEINSKDFRTWGARAQALYHAGVRGGELAQVLGRAIELGEETLRVSPGQPRTLSLLSVYYARRGDSALARQRIAEALLRHGGDLDALTDVAVAYQILGEREQAVRWAQTALDRGLRPENLKNEPDLERLTPFLQIPGRR